MDWLDRAQAHQDFLLKNALHNHKHQQRPALLPNGICHNCGEAVDEARRFCDADCRDDFDKREQRKLAL